MDPEQIFLTTQAEAAATLTASTDLVDVTPVGSRHYVLHYHCRGLVKDAAGVLEHDDFVVGAFLHDGYLRRSVAAAVLRILSPLTTFHPNTTSSLMCIGTIRPGTGIAELCARAYEVLTFQSFTANEHDALNREACAWVRRNLERLPIDARPLIWRRATPAVPPEAGR
jgi:hypothetical protein